MKILALTLELMARMALFTAVMALSIGSIGQRRQPATVKQPPKRPQA